MYQIKRFFDCQVPVNRCNFECSYCTVGQWEKVQGSRPKEYTLFNYDTDRMRKALSLKRLGGVCAFNLCGNGETFFHPQILDLVDALLDEGHFVSIVSNGTVSKSIDYLCSMEEEKRSRIFIKFSFHYLELKKRNLLDLYFSNVNKIHQSGISLTVELVASDDNVPFIDEIKSICLERLGVLCHLTDPRLNTAEDIRHLTEMPMEEHLKVWSPFNSALFDYRQETWGQSRKNCYCYAGVWSFNLNLATGRLKQCYRNSDTVQFIFDHEDEPIHFIPRGTHCSFAHCFNSHVFDCFCGVIPDIESPYYSELRNRVLPDGSEWIKGPYKEIYNRRICENNLVYPKEKKEFLDGILDLWNEIIPDENYKKIILDILKKLGKQHAVTIYGDNKISDYLKGVGEVAYYNGQDNAIVIITDFANYPNIKDVLKTENIYKILNVVDMYDEAQ